MKEKMFYLLIKALTLTDNIFINQLEYKEWFDLVKVRLIYTFFINCILMFL